MFLNTLRGKCPNTEFFLVRIFLHLDWIRRFTEFYRVNLRIQSKYRKIRTRENSIFGQFLHSVFFLNFTCNKFCDFTKITQKREFYSVRMRKNAGKMRTRITPNTDIFYAVCISSRSIFIKKELFNWSFPDILWNNINNRF